VRKLFFIGFLFAMFPLVLKAQQESTVKKSEIIESIDGKQFYMHFIKQGETLFEIAKVYGVTVEEIQTNNPSAKSGIKAGQILKVPLQQSKNKSNIQQPKNEDTFQHIVKSKETLYGISRIYGADINEIKRLNPGLSDSVKEGQVINIPIRYKPGKSSSEKSGYSNQHIVQSGETLYSISRQYGLSPDDLRQANPGISPSLSVGQKIIIPEPQLQKTYFLYTAEKNEKLQDIAIRFKVSYEELSALNPEVIKKVGKGDKVKIPSKPDEKPIKKQEEPEPEIKIQQNALCIEEGKNMQTSYNVALMLPLFLEEVDSLNNAVGYAGESVLSASPFKFIQFYEGFMMAVDSLNKAGLKMNLYVYDVDNSSQKINLVLKKPEISSMDLIIGPFYSESFKKMADFALLHNIWIVNPLSAREEIINGYPNVFKLKPSLSFQAEQLAVYITQHQPESNIIIIRQNKYKYQEEVSFLKNYLNSHRASSSNIRNKEILHILDSLKTDKLLSDNLLITKERLSRSLDESISVSNTVKEFMVSNDSASNLKYSLSHIRNNFIIVLSDEKVFCQDLMSHLNKLTENYKITLFGSPEWQKFDDLDNQYLVNMNTHFFVPAIIDYDDYGIKKWIGNFRKNYSTEPLVNLYAFDGFDAGWYFLNALFRYGKNFENCLNQMNIHLTQTQFTFENLKGNGFQNTHWNIGLNSDFRFIPIK
jgi:LysM repeat protein